MNLLSIIPLPYKIAGIAALCALVTAGGWWLHHSIAQGGYDRCMADNRADQAQAEDAARKKLIDTGKRYEKTKYKESALEGRNTPAGDYLRSVLDLLPEPRSGRGQ